MLNTNTIDASLSFTLLRGLIVWSFFYYSTFLSFKTYHFVGQAPQASGALHCVVVYVVVVTVQQSNNHNNVSLSTPTTTLVTFVDAMDMH